MTSINGQRIPPAGLRKGSRSAGDRTVHKPVMLKLSFVDWAQGGLKEGSLLHSSSNEEVEYAEMQVLF